MLQKRWGRIVNITTSLDTMYRQGTGGYGPCKAALEAASRVMASDLADSGVTANVLVPGGPVNTRMIPTVSGFEPGKLIQPETMCAPLIWLCSEEANHVNGVRIVAQKWKPDVPLDKRLAEASAPIAWPQLGAQSVFPANKSRHRTMKIAVPDLISNSYFPAVAAVELGILKQEGLAAEISLIFPVDRAYGALRNGEVDFVAGSAHSALSAFPEWKGVKLICAQGQGMYWFLVMRSDLNPRRNDLSIVKGRKIGAAPWVEMGLRRLLAAGGIDIVRDEVQIAPVPGASGTTVNFGLTAALALEKGLIDGFWANGMGTEVAVRAGVGSVVLDIRRGDGPSGCFDYTMASVATTDQKISSDLKSVEAVVRAIVRTQQTLKRDPAKAAEVGAKVFPKSEAGLIEDLIRRDIPYYDARILQSSTKGMNSFCRDLGILRSTPRYEDIVAVGLSSLWTPAD
jgi:ABC-type nitrate/sulfonate/bicarbonate transport system substrate-binding protein